jgi:Domain of unknown function DUF21./CBS domain./Transporter associated domain.
LDDISDYFSIAVLIAIAAFFVVSEFTIIKIRHSSIEELLEKGKAGAKSASKILSNLDSYLSLCQMGIAASALAVGFYTGSRVQNWMAPIFKDGIPETAAQLLSALATFFILTFVYMVFGELLPKLIAIQKAERLALWLAFPLVLFYRVFYPFLWLFQGSARLIGKLFGIRPISKADNAHSEEELRSILTESYKSGKINLSEFNYVNKVFEFDNRIAKEIMVPRTEMVSIDIDDSLDTLKEIVNSEKFTRYPVTDGDKDHIIGLINIKELLTALISGEKLTKETLRKYIRPIIQVIETIPIHDLLVKMQKEQIHMAVLLDEYGGTSGLVTVEDIVEEIVGEIRDEFDMDEIPLIRKITEDHYIFDAKVLISEVNELLDLDLDDEDFDTLGGWLLTVNFPAKQGDIIRYGDFEFEILEMEEHHIRFVEVRKMKEHLIEDFERAPDGRHPVSMPATKREAM